MQLLVTLEYQGYPNMVKGRDGVSVGEASNGCSNSTTY